MKPSERRLKAAVDLTDGANKTHGDERDEMRGGCRGGRALFSWDAVKTDRQRNMYLGNSIKANIWRAARPSDWFRERTIEGEEGNVEGIRKEEEIARRVTARYGMGALNDLEKFKALLAMEENGRTSEKSRSSGGGGGDGNVESSGRSSLLEELRVERMKQDKTGREHRKHPYHQRRS